MIILDTNVLSELMRPQAAPDVVAWVAKHEATELCTTSITEAELFYGVQLLTPGQRRDRLLEAVESMFTEDFAGRIFGFDSEAARAFARIAAHRRGLGRPISHAEAQIAAIARVRGAMLATRNVTDFQDCGVGLVNPWENPLRPERP